MPPSTPAQEEPESNHTSIVSVPLRQCSASAALLGGSSSASVRSHHTSVPWAAISPWM